MIGRIVITRPRSTIILVDASKDTSKFLLVDAAHPDTGYKPGDLVMPGAWGKIHLFGGSYHRPILNKASIVTDVTDWQPRHLLIQNDAATKFVPFDSTEAARPLDECLQDEETDSLLSQEDREVA
jgi:hypothetical protein